MSVFTVQDEEVAVATARLPRVNLLPPEIAQRAAFRRVQAGLALALVATVAAVGVVAASASGSVEDAQAQIDSAAVENSALASQASEFANVNRVYARAAAAQAMLTAAMGTEVRYSRFLNDLSFSIPENVWITQATFAQGGASPLPGTGGGLGTVTMSGVAYEHNDVAVWLEALAKQRGYAQPFLSSSKKTLIGNREVSEWTTTVELTTAALSGRYLTPAGD